jgi:hypothetical protein
MMKCHARSGLLDRRRHRAGTVRQLDLRSYTFAPKKEGGALHFPSEVQTVSDCADLTPSTSDEHADINCGLIVFHLLSDSTDDLRES